MKAFSYTRAASVSEAVGQLTSSGRTTVALSGGTDLMDLMKEGIVAPDVVVSLSGISGLDTISTQSGGTLRIGARVTLAQLAANSVIATGFKALSDAAGNAATPQIRNMATIGGNLLQRPRCWYFRKEELSCLKKGGSSCPAVNGENRYLAILGGGPCYAVHASSPSCALLALDAKVNVTGASGARQIDLGGFFALPSVDPTRENNLLPGDVITSIDLAPLPAGSTSAYIKVKQKEAFDWAMAEVAVRLTVSSGKITDSRVILGAVAPVPWRSTAAENALKGQTVSSSLMTQAAQAALTGAKPLSDNGWKVPVAQSLVEQALKLAAGLS